MFVSGINSISFAGRNNDGRRKVDETDVSLLGGSAAAGGKATKELVNKLTTTTKGVNEGSKFIARVSEQTPKITGSFQGNKLSFVKRFYDWAGSTKLMKYAEPIMHNPIVKKVVGAGAGVFALAYAGHELGQLATSGTQTYETISNLDFKLTA